MNSRKTTPHSANFESRSGSVIVSHESWGT